MTLQSTTSTAEFVARGLEKAKRSGKGWTARCPTHDDRNPSLSICDGDNGMVLVNCFAGCRPEDVLEKLTAMGLLDKKPFRNGNGTGPIPPVDTTRHVTKTYPYYSPDDFETPAYFKRRYNIRPNFDHDRKVDTSYPYRLPDWLEGSRGNRLLIAEGEKDADRLAALGYAVTTNSTGAGGWPSDPEYNRLLTGFSVVILYDQDDPGRKRVPDVAAKIGDYVDDVKVAELGIPEGNDVSNWLDDGGTGVALDRHLDDAMTLRDWEHRDRPPVILTWAEYRELAKQQPAGNYIVPNLYRRGQSSLLVGEPKAGKSTLCRRLAVAVAKGGRVLGYDVDAATVVYMPLQEDAQHVVREVEAVNPDDPDPGLRFYTHNPESAMEWERLAGAVVDIEASLVVVDMVSDFKVWDDANNYNEMKIVIGQFTRLARDTGAHVLLVHHGKKTPASYPTARVLGSQAIAGEVDVVASIHRDKERRIFEAEGRGIGFFTHAL